MCIAVNNNNVHRQGVIGVRVTKRALCRTSIPLDRRSVEQCTQKAMRNITVTVLLVQYGTYVSLTLSSMRLCVHWMLDHEIRMQARFRELANLSARRCWHEKEMSEILFAVIMMMKQQCLARDGGPARSCVVSIKASDAVVWGESGDACKIRTRCVVEMPRPPRDLALRSLVASYSRCYYCYHHVHHHRCGDRCPGQLCQVKEFTIW